MYLHACHRSAAMAYTHHGGAQDRPTKGGCNCGHAQAQHAPGQGCIGPLLHGCDESDTHEVGLRIRDNLVVFCTGEDNGQDDGDGEEELQPEVEVSIVPAHLMTASEHWTLITLVRRNPVFMIEASRDVATVYKLIQLLS